MNIVEVQELVRQEVERSKASVGTEIIRAIRTPHEENIIAAYGQSFQLESEVNSSRLLLGEGDLASVLGISRRHVASLDTQGLLPEPVRLGTCKRWPRSEIIAWVDARCPKRDRWAMMRSADCASSK